MISTLPLILSRATLETLTTGKKMERLEIKNMKYPDYTQVEDPEEITRYNDNYGEAFNYYLLYWNDSYISKIYGAYNLKEDSRVYLMDTLPESKTSAQKLVDYYINQEIVSIKLLKNGKIYGHRGDVIETFDPESEGVLDKIHLREITVKKLNKISLRLKGIPCY